MEYFEDLIISYIFKSSLHLFENIITYINYHFTRYYRYDRRTDGKVFLPLLPGEW